jgi:hypothetical protein
MLGGIVLTTTKSLYKDSKVDYSTQDPYLRMKCPNCDKRRSGPCDHSGMPDYELLDRIKLRLALARTKALEKYQEKWG